MESTRPGINHQARSVDGFVDRTGEAGADTERSGQSVKTDVAIPADSCGCPFVSHRADEGAGVPVGCVRGNGDDRLRN